MKSLQSNKAFSLAEVLIALAVLAVVAVFTIPKVLMSFQHAGWNAAAKNVSVMIQSAYNEYQMEAVPDGSFKTGDLTQYFNYVSIDTSSFQVDGVQTDPPLVCSTYANVKCYHLHDGGVLFFDGLENFSTTNTTAAVNFHYDPDGKACGAGACDGKAIRFSLYYDGTIAVPANGRTPTCGSWGCWNGYPEAFVQPPWFSWTE